MSRAVANIELTAGIRESCHPKWKIVIGFLLTILVHSFPVYAASFDCRKATMAAEKMICSDAALSKLDEDMAKVYAQALVAAPNREALKSEQRDWVKNTRNRCKNNECLSSSYQTRMLLLTKAYSSNQISTSDQVICGTWEELKPAAGGPFYIKISPQKLVLSLCDKNIYDLIHFKGNEYLYTARINGKCSGYDKRTQLTVLRLSMTDSNLIQVQFYSGLSDKDWIGTDNFFRME